MKQLIFLQFPIKWLHKCASGELYFYYAYDTKQIRHAMTEGLRTHIYQATDTNVVWTNIGRPILDAMLNYPRSYNL